MNAEKLASNFYKEFSRRLYSKNGGAEIDLKNFCTTKDFDWLREQLEEDLSEVFETARENDIDGFELDEEITDIVYKLKDEINELESRVSFKNIIPYLNNEFTNFSFKYDTSKRIDEMFEELKQKLKKALYINFEDLNEEKSEIYKEALSIIEDAKKRL